MTALPVSQTVLVNGGPDSLLQLVGQGLLGSGQPAVIAGDSLPVSRPAVWAVTDGQRREDTLFGLVNANVSYTYTATETNPAGAGQLGAGKRIPLGRWGYLVIDPPTSALAVHLLEPRAGLQAGTVILVAVVTGSKSKRATAQRRKRKRHATHEPLKVTPPLALSHYTFPVLEPAEYIDTYGAFRSDVPGNWHHGDDIFAPLGTPVVAVATGTINRVGWEHLGGWRLWVRDAAGDEFYYAHLSGYTAGDLRSNKVKAGEVIGFIGNTGDAFTTSPHLHFEIHPRSLLHLGYDGAVDPTLLPRPVDAPQAHSRTRARPSAATKIPTVAERSAVRLPRAACSTPLDRPRTQAQPTAAHQDPKRSQRLPAADSSRKRGDDPDEGRPERPSAASVCATGWTRIAHPLRSHDRDCEDSEPQAALAPSSKRSGLPMETSVLRLAPLCAFLVCALALAAGALASGGPVFTVVPSGGGQDASLNQAIRRQVKADRAAVATLLRAQRVTVALLRRTEAKIMRAADPFPADAELHACSSNSRQTRSEPAASAARSEGSSSLCGPWRYPSSLRTSSSATSARMPCRLPSGTSASATSGAAAIPARASTAPAS